MLRVVFMGTPQFSVSALEACHKHFKVVAVVTRPDQPAGRGQKLTPPPVKVCAEKLGLPIFQPIKLNTPEEIAKLKNLNADAFVVVAYSQLLKREVLDIPSLGCFNIHASLLPHWRGAAPIQYSIWKGDSETGITIMKMEEGLDSGPVLLQKSIPILANDTSATLFEKLSPLGAELIVEALEGYRDGKLKLLPQDHSKVTLSPKLSKELEWINLEISATEADHQIRAFEPWPGSSILVHGEKLKIKEGRPRPELKGKKGELYLEAGTLLLGLGQGCLELVAVQPEGKRAQNSSEYVNGLRGRGLSLPTQASSGTVKK